MDIKEFCIEGDQIFKIQSFNTDQTDDLTKEKAETMCQANLILMEQIQDKLYAEKKEALLIIMQGMDAAGKDGAIKHVISGMNPQGINVNSFKTPTSEELDHDYLWRAMRVIPRRGEIGIFNRSYYEDVLIEKVHNLYTVSYTHLRAHETDSYLVC